MLSSIGQLSEVRLQNVCRLLSEPVFGNGAADLPVKPGINREFWRFR
jgi:hypothetical protein